jgi:hypothetical protein
MAITSLSGKAIQPTQAKTAILDQFNTSTVATQNTWYTVLNVSSAKGTFNRVSAAIYASGSFNWNRYTEVRITIDGVANSITNTFATGNNYFNGLRGFDHTSGTPAANAGLVFEYNSTLYFNQSLVVEVRQTLLTSCNIQALVDYALI